MLPIALYNTSRTAAAGLGVGGHSSVRQARQEYTLPPSPGRARLLQVSGRDQELTNFEQHLQGRKAAMNYGTGNSL